MTKEMLSKLDFFKNLALDESELFLLKGGVAMSSIQNPGCGCGSGQGCGCGCSNGSGCLCYAGQGCGCGCITVPPTAPPVTPPIVTPAC